MAVKLLLPLLSADTDTYLEVTFSVTVKDEVSVSHKSKVGITSPPTAEINLEMIMFSMDGSILNSNYILCWQ